LIYLKCSFSNSVHKTEVAPFSIEINSGCDIYGLSVNDIIISNLSDTRQVHSLFQNDSSTYCDLELPHSNESILFCPQGHPATTHVFFLVGFAPTFRVYLSVPSSRTKMSKKKARVTKARVYMEKMSGLR
jgi:hypothetical protein